MTAWTLSGSYLSLVGGGSVFQPHSGPQSPGGEGGREGGSSSGTYMCKDAPKCGDVNFFQWGKQQGHSSEVQLTLRNFPTSSRMSLKTNTFLSPSNQPCFVRRAISYEQHERGHICVSLSQSLNDAAARDLRDLQGQRLQGCGVRA